MEQRRNTGPTKVGRNTIRNRSLDLGALSGVALTKTVHSSLTTIKKKIIHDVQIVTCDNCTRFFFNLVPPETRRTSPIPSAPDAAIQGCLLVVVGSVCPSLAGGRMRLTMATS